MATTSLEDLLAKGNSFQDEYLQALNPDDLLSGLRQLQDVFTAYADFLPDSPEEDETTVVDPLGDQPPSGVRSSLAQVMDDQQRLTHSLSGLRLAVMNLPEEDETTVDLRTLLMCVNQDYLKPALQALSTWIATHQPNEEAPSTPLHLD